MLRNPGSATRLARRIELDRHQVGQRLPAIYPAAPPLASARAIHDLAPRCRLDLTHRPPLSPRPCGPWWTRSPRGYEARDELPLLEGRSWSELEPKLLERHATLLVHAVGALYRAILPGYVLLVAEHELQTALPFHVAGQLTRGDHAIEQQIFDERVGPMTAEQRAVVRHAIVFLAKQALMRDVMKAALRSW